MNLTRRSGLAALAGVLGAPAVFRVTDAMAQAPSVRKTVETLSASELALFRAAVGGMRANQNYGDPRSWMYWAWMHEYRVGDIVLAVREDKLSRADAVDRAGVTEAVLDQALGGSSANWVKRSGANRAWSQCPHHDTAKLFLPWHRAYLLFFEEVLRSYAAVHDASAAATMRLPYFDPFAADGVVPAILADEKLADGSANSLWHPQRNAVLKKSDLDFAHQNGLLEAVDAGGELLNFSVKVENPAHDYIHGLCGGDMEDPRTAARDPIFWLHHANVDRHWLVLDSSGANSAPSIVAWNTPMPFRVTATETRQILPAAMKSASLLEPPARRYTYADPTNIVSGRPRTSTPTAPPQRPQRRLSAGAGAVGLGANVQSLSRRRQVRLTNEPLALRFGVPGANRSQLRASIEGATLPPNISAARITLVLEDVRAVGEGNLGLQQIALAPRDGAETLNPFVVGAVSRWALGMAHREHSAHVSDDAGVTLRIPLTGREVPVDANAAAVEVWFLPSEQEPHEGAFEIGEARLEFETAPDR